MTNKHSSCWSQGLTGYITKVKHDTDIKGRRKMENST